MCGGGVGRPLRRRLILISPRYQPQAIRKRIAQAQEDSSSASAAKAAEEKPQAKAPRRAKGKGAKGAARAKTLDLGESAEPESSALERYERSLGVLPAADKWGVLRRIPSESKRSRGDPAIVVLINEMVAVAEMVQTASAGELNVLFRNCSLFDSDPEAGNGGLLQAFCDAMHHHRHTLPAPANGAKVSPGCHQSTCPFQFPLTTH